MREFRVRVSSILIWLAVFIFVLYSFTTGLTDRVFPMSAYSVIVLMLCGLIILYRYREFIWKMDFMDTLAILMMFVILFFNNYNLKHHAWHWGLFPVLFIMFYLLGKNSEKWMHYTMRLIIVFGLFYTSMTFYVAMNPGFFYSTVLSLFRYYGNNTSLALNYENGYIPGFTPNTGTNAMYLAAALITLLSKQLTDKKKQIIQIINILLISAALVATGKRAHTVFVVLAIIVGYFYLNSDKPLGRWFKVVFGAAVVAAIVIIAEDNIPLFSSILTNWELRFAQKNFDTGRTVLRAEALSMFMQKPIFGMGWDAMKYLNVKGSNAHCVYLQLLGEAGIVGAIPFYLFFTLSLHNTIQIMKKIIIENSSDSFARYALCFSIMTQVFFLLYCLTGNPLYDAAILFPYMAACAVGEHYRKRLKYRLV